MEDTVTPAVPTTTGALLAEEWTINPFATLPSFLEMFMMEEADRSACKSLDTGLGLLQRKLEAHGQQRLLSTSSSTIQGGSSSLSSWSVLLRQSYATMALHMSKWLQAFHPEIRCFVLYMLERRCLRSDACATISESLYGGRRTKVEQPQPHKTRQEQKLLPLSDRDKTRLALIVAVGPYLRHRLMLLYERWKQGAHETANDNIRKLFVWVYPWLHVSLNSLDVYYKWRYLIGQSVFFHPSSQLLGLLVRRVTLEDSPSFTATASCNGGGSNTMEPTTSTSRQPMPGHTQGSLEPPNKTTATNHPWQRGAMCVLSSAVVLSWMSHFRLELRRLRHEHNLLQRQQQGSTSSSSSRLPTNYHGQPSSYPPPPASGIANAATALPRHLCPICRQPRVHPTAVSTSGFVFCLKCLSKHVHEMGTCPITGRKCTERDMLRLYEPNHHQTTPVSSPTRFQTK